LLNELKTFDDTALKYSGQNPNDVVFTKDIIAKWIIDEMKPTGSILEPCKGEGAFMKYIPNADWCEITEGRDFMEYNKKVDWIITNPPHSKFDDFLKHSMELAKNIVFLIPTAKMLKSYKNIQMIKNYGGIKKLMFVRADKCGFPFGFPCGVFHLVKDYEGLTEIKYYE